MTMSATTRTTTGKSRRSGGTSRALSAVGLLAALALGTGAYANVGAQGEGGDGTPGFSPGDLVGTLPVFIGGDSPSDAINNPALMGMKAVVQPAFTVYGSNSALQDLIDDASGNGFVTVYGQPGAGTQRLVFHGDVSVSLDRSVLLRQSFETQLWIGSGFGSALGVVSYEGTRGAAFHAGSDSQVDLPLSALAATDVLDSGQVSIALTNRAGDLASLKFTANDELVFLDQSIPD
jgi:hypothetical protein